MVGKLGVNWEGLYQIKEMTPGKAHLLKNIEGMEESKKWNAQYLKKYSF